MVASNMPKKTVWVLALLAAIIVAVMFFPYTEGLTIERKNPKATEAKVKYETTLNMDNDGSRLGDPLPWDKNSSLSQSLTKCKNACAGLADCLGFTQELDLKQCVLKSSKGTNTESATVSSFWKV